jgi:phosphatidylserine decarboxylase
VPVLSPFGKPHTTIIIAAGVVGTAALLGMQQWIAAGVAVLIAVLLLAFFRDPHRPVPTMKGHVVAPADGRVSSVHTVDHFEPFNGPAVCIRIFLSVFDVHVNRSPMHGRAISIVHKPGKHLNALRADSAEHNESVLMVLNDPLHERPVCAVRQIAGAIARRIVCNVHEGEILQRGQRYGMIKFGSTTELYLPHPNRVAVQVARERYVYGGQTVVAIVSPPLEHPEGKVAADSQARG